MKLKSFFLGLIFFVAIGVHSQTFIDNLTTEIVGNSPSKWKIINGAAQIATQNGEKIIALNDKSIIAPLTSSSDYLKDKFSLDFEANFARLDKAIYYYQSYQIRFWDGHW